MKCVLIFSTNFYEMFLIRRKTQRDIIKNVHTSLCKLRFILVGFNETLIFSTDFRKDSKYQTA
jgi:chemotaxis methyl-accepting protein methylase